MKLNLLLKGDFLSKITVTDDGTGMDLETIENAWLVNRY